MVTKPGQKPRQGRVLQRVAVPAHNQRPAIGAAMHIVVSNARLHIVSRALRALLRPVGRADLVRIGSEYGGWWIPKDLAAPGTVAYCAGAGEDITFDLALVERGCQVTTFDPTPRAIAHVEANAPSGNDFRFVPVGWWNEDTILRFYAPRIPQHVSHSAVNLQGTTDFFTAPVKPVRQPDDRTR